MNEALEQVIRHWTVAQPVVSAYITSLVRDFAARDDVLQDVAVAIVQSHQDYDTTRPFLHWALAIARNQVRLYYRRQVRQRLLFDEQLLEQLATTFEHQSSHDLRMLDQLEHCLEQLDERSRALCHARYAEDLPPAKLAATFHMTANTVSKTLQRIRERLRDCIVGRASREARST